MKDAGILEGDFVVVRPADDAANGEIVVALVGDEATVKRFFREKDHIRLQPENKSDEADSHAATPGSRPRRRSLQEGLVSAVATETAAVVRRPHGARQSAQRLFEPSG